MSHTKFQIDIVFDSTFPTTTEVVQAAVLRAVNTRAFALQGRILVHVTPKNIVPPAAEDLARPGICPCRRCDAPLKRGYFVCGAHFKKLPARMQAVLGDAKGLDASALAEHAGVLAETLLACVGFVARAEGHECTRDEEAAMSKFTPTTGNA